MPTGYTAGIIDGTITTFPQFAKLCMKNFGACMHMRDENMDKLYEPQSVSDYHTKEIAKAQKELKAALEISDDKIISIRSLELLNSKEYHLKAIEKKLNNQIILNEMLEKAKAYIPPTTEHNGIKEFMIQQIESTIDFDCKGEYNTESLAETEKALSCLDAKEIRKTMIDSATRNLSYHTNEYNAEVKRCNDSNKWVEDFLKSIA